MQYANNLEDAMLSYCQLQFADHYNRMQITQLTNQLLQLTIISFEYETQIRLQKSFGSIVLSSACQ